MYHRVIPKNPLVQDGMYVSPETFDSHLCFLSKYFVIVSFSELFSDNSLHLTYKKNDKPRCILTFDDGWKDFYEHAWPILSMHQKPATVFLPTKFIGSDEIFWSDQFAYILSNRKKAVSINSLDSDTAHCIEMLNKLAGPYWKQLESGIEILKAYPLEKIIRILKILHRVWKVEDDTRKHNFLNWTEVQELHASGLISFGSHTVNHQILTSLNRESVRSELILSFQDLMERNLFDESCRSFCYPNGNHTDEIAGMVRSSGYSLAVTTKSGWNNEKTNLYTLRRIGVHEDMTRTKTLFACRIAGIL